ncbi:MAG: isoprenylcysteine carboxylmethyltransferase family protein [Bacteroidales bacterium]|nr:isoprenylcysteine carboxylmethyltransferase family protein [Bacteroidales bacterium]
MKIVNIITICTCYGLIMASFFHSLNLAKREHHISLKDVKNEVPHGYRIRFLLSILYYFCIVDWIVGFEFIQWAYIPENILFNVLGIALMTLTTSLFWRTSISLGSNYHGPMKLHTRHELVKTGSYRVIRHAAYLAFSLFHISLFLITNNYILLLSGLIMSIYINHFRIRTEEKLLTERFGQEYAEYKKMTGKYLPVLFK